MAIEREREKKRLQSRSCAPTQFLTQFPTLNSSFQIKAAKKVYNTKQNPERRWF